MSVMCWRLGGGNEKSWVHVTHATFAAWIAVPPSASQQEFRAPHAVQFFNPRTAQL
jgi:hypothetical protein